MLISALFVGLCLGFSAYHLFIARYILQQGMTIGMQYAAADLQDFLQSLEPEVRKMYEEDMQNYAYNRKLKTMMQRLGRK